ncbi:unnamed protein product [Bemisia tabaci]|uniref:VOC domain-containing protein n=1 Tax=Bemisia tabaci TaxID=7038 RepID=A0A9P0AH41_BEMTA|nr:PREDICTED: glyoxalase domain-containing protein 4 [Bemisia tabaci]CAH0390606.1 unnamed protein product [Bemisia tabaci]
MVAGRALHFVFKVADRTLTAKFYREILGMKILRHEEFKEGCEAACNGPYDGRWSKTMVGYGSEDNHFVVELTYNYNVPSYDLGNDYLGITVRSKQAIENAKKNGWPLKEENGVKVVEAPGGYKFFLLNEEQPTNKDPVEKVTLASTDLKKSIEYWNKTLGLKLYENDSSHAIVGFADDQAKLELKAIGEPINHATAYGRIAFSVPVKELQDIDKIIKSTNNKILTPLVTLPTPGKADVTVIILADPDGHEICFVGDESYRELSKFDPEGEKLLDRYIKKDEERKAN